MTFNVHDFRTYIIGPTLELCADLAGVPDTPYVRDLLVATCAQESRLGTWLHQTGSGPAISIYQLEPATLDDLLRNFASAPKYRDILRASMVEGQPAVDQIIWNLRFATICARLNYYRVREPLPRGTTFDSLWHYYKTYWNTRHGAATSASFRDALKLTDIVV